MSDEEWAEVWAAECEDTLARTYQPIIDETETEFDADPWGLWSTAMDRR